MLSYDSWKSNTCRGFCKLSVNFNVGNCEKKGPGRTCADLDYFSFILFYFPTRVWNATRGIAIKLIFGDTNAKLVSATHSYAKGLVLQKVFDHAISVIKSTLVPHISRTYSTHHKLNKTIALTHARRPSLIALPPSSHQRIDSSPLQLALHCIVPSPVFVFLFVCAVQAGRQVVSRTRSFKPVNPVIFFPSLFVSRSVSLLAFFFCL